MDAIRQVADDHLYVIEDAAKAARCDVQGTRRVAGAHGDVRFYGNKIITAWGG
jgi:dTDP-4-amino-4,6-dideoxygalactose transaminase